MAKPSAVAVLKRLAPIVGTLSVVAAALALGGARLLDPRPRIYRDMVEADLGRLADAQEGYRAEHGHYARDFGAVAFVPANAVTLGFNAIDEGWSATADLHIDQNFPFVDINVRCTLAVGEVERAQLGPMDVSKATRGQIRCDE